MYQIKKKFESVNQEQKAMKIKNKNLRDKSDKRCPVLIH